MGDAQSGSACEPAAQRLANPGYALRFPTARFLASRLAWDAEQQNYHPFEPPEDPEEMPIPRLEVPVNVGEQYEIVSSLMGFTDTDLNRVREFAQRQFTQGALDAGYQIKGYRAQTYTIRYFLHPSVRYSVQIVLKREIPLPQEQGNQ